MKTNIMNIFFDIAVVLYAIILVWNIVSLVRTRSRLRRETDAVRVQRNMKYVKTALICAVISAVLSAVIVYFDFDEMREIKSGLKDCRYYPYSNSETIEEYRARIYDKSEAHCKLWGILCFGWTLTAALRAYELIYGKQAVVTDKGVYVSDSFRPAEKVRYDIKDNKLLIYYGKRDTPAEYTVTQDKEHLLSTLSANYTKYKEPYASDAP